jgi:hypothetical protein
MIVVKYNLTKDGHVPSYIIDGGYFPKANNKSSPQDCDLIGISSGSNALGEFKTEAELKSYFDTFTMDWKDNDHDDTKWNQTQEAKNIWNKL